MGPLVSSRGLIGSWCEGLDEDGALGFGKGPEGRLRGVLSSCVRVRTQKLVGLQELVENLLGARQCRGSGDSAENESPCPNGASTS